eukprot:124312-Hanusia_phi.AAC.1
MRGSARKGRDGREEGRRGEERRKIGGWRSSRWRKRVNFGHMETCLTIVQGLSVSVVKNAQRLQLSVLGRPHHLTNIVDGILLDLPQTGKEKKRKGESEGARENGR